MEQKALSRKEALEAIRSCWTPARTNETVPLEAALDRVLAEDLYARYSLPVVRSSTMDGIGVASALFRKGEPDTAYWQRGRDYVRADTGDDFDDRFDAVIPVEAVTFLEGGGVLLAPGTKVTPGMHMRTAGSSVARGDLLLRAGTRLRPFDLAAAVMGGHTKLTVVKKPVVAFLPTGSELIPPGTEPARGENIDSNSVLAQAMLTEMGAQPLLFPITSDNPALLRTAICAAAERADMILLCGGSSKGGEDFNAGLAGELGTLLFHSVAAAPGRPMAAAMLDGKPLINVSGPPHAAYFILDWCVSELVSTFLGIEQPLRKTVRARLTKPLEATPGMEILRRFELLETERGLEAVPVSGRGGPVCPVLTASAQFVTESAGSGLEAGEALELTYLR